MKISDGIAFELGRSVVKFVLGVLAIGGIYLLLK